MEPWTREQRMLLVPGARVRSRDIWGTVVIHDPDADGIEASTKVDVLFDGQGDAWICDLGDLDPNSLIPTTRAQPSAREMELAANNVWVARLLAAYREELSDGIRVDEAYLALITAGHSPV